MGSEKAAKVETSKQMAIFAPSNEGDDATRILNAALATPMIKGTPIKGPFGQKQKFKLTSFLEGDATKENLGKIWTGDIPHGRPALVFTGSHGMVFASGDTRQAAQQGAIVTQEWIHGAAPTPEQYFHAGEFDNLKSAKVHGMVHFLFACFGGGWPVIDTYVHTPGRPAQIAPTPGMARLPQALLAHPNGGALAVLGHIDRAWACSFAGTKDEPQVEGFRSVMNRIMSGSRLGNATDSFNMRWAGVSVDLTRMLQQKLSDVPVDKKLFVDTWINRDDARNYVLYGDPAVRVRVKDMPDL